MEWGRRRVLAVSAAVVAILGLSAAYALGGGGRRTASAFSPDGSYRVDWVTPDRLDRSMHADMSTPARIELRNDITGRLVGTSEVVDVDAGGNGQPAWLMKDMGVVSIGPGAQSLHVPPLAPDGRPLPIDKKATETAQTDRQP